MKAHRFVSPGGTHYMTPRDFCLRPQHDSRDTEYVGVSNLPRWKFDAIVRRLERRA